MHGDVLEPLAKALKNGRDWASRPRPRPSFTELSGALQSSAQLCRGLHFQTPSRNNYLHENFQSFETSIVPKFEQMLLVHYHLRSINWVYSCLKCREYRMAYRRSWSFDSWCSNIFDTIHTRCCFFFTLTTTRLQFAFFIASLCILLLKLPLNSHMLF